MSLRFGPVVFICGPQVEPGRFHMRAPSRARSFLYGVQVEPGRFYMRAPSRARSFFICGLQVEPALRVKNLEGVVPHPSSRNMIIHLIQVKGVAYDCLASFKAA